ncbi:MAG: hypothetical protein LBE09_00840 [Christensenellaceae bacterium]|nr:hypothetical protein [Christensenellaceae bacterium]
MYYLKKYIGVREIVLTAFLFIAGLVLGLGFNNLVVLILCAATIALIAFCIALYVAVASGGYKQEFEKRGATKWEISFNELGVTADVFENDGTTKFTDKKLYEDIDKIALLKDKAYVYFSTAIMFYINYTDFRIGNFVDFCEFIRERVDPKKLKMKAKFRRYKEIK